MQDPRLQAVLEIARTVGSTLDLDELLQRIMEQVTQLVQADRSTLYLVAEDGGLWSRVVQGDDRLEIRLPAGTGVAGWVARRGEAVRLDDAYADARFDRGWDRATGYRTRSLLCVPFRNAKGRIVGVMQCLNRRGGSFTAEHQELLEVLGGQCAVALENAMLYASLQKRNEELARTEEQLRRANGELEILVELERTLHLAPDEEIALGRVLSSLLERVQGAAAALVLDDAGARHIALVQGATRSRRIPRERALFLLRGLEAPSQREDVVAELVEGAPGTTVTSVLLEGGEQVFGALQLVQAAPDPGALRVLQLVASRLAQGIGARRALREREKQERLSLLGQMVSGILHDLRTPMAAASGYAELMTEEEDPAERSYYAGRIRGALELMEAMTQEVLAYARGQREVLVGEVALAPFVDEVQAMIAPELERFGTDFAVEVRRLEGSGRFDASKLKRVLFNLARNAGQAGAGSVTWTIDQDGEHLALAFADDGPGIPEEIRGRLFQPFATFGKEGGTGLGLAMAQQIVEAHLGSIAVTSEPGHGTTFLIRLPLRGVEATPLL